MCLNVTDLGNISLLAIGNTRKTSLVNPYAARTVYVTRSDKMRRKSTGTNQITHTLSCLNQ